MTATSRSLPRDPPTERLRFARPPRIQNARGATRAVGIEIEFAGLGVPEACALVRGLFGGTAEVTNRFSSVVRGAEFGDWGVEIDSKALTQQRYKEFLDRIGAGNAVTGFVEDVLETVARQWIPSEIVSPPIPMTKLERTEEVRHALYRSHADGTRASILYMFGFQLNPEIHTLDAPTITSHLRAFLALYDWLHAVAEIDITRRISSCVDPFPEEYRMRVLDPAYAPDLDELIDDYLEANPTRNRALDMLPMFALLQKEKVMAAALEPTKVKPRPTFHYRLPNCLVDDPAWSFALEWNRWVEIERLAADPARLARVSEDVRVGARELDRAEWSMRAREWGVEAA